MAIPTVIDTTASKKQHLASLGYLSRKQIVVKEPKTEKLRDKTKAWNKEWLLLNMIVGTRCPSTFWYGNLISTNVAATDAHNITFSADCTFVCDFPYMVLGVGKFSEKSLHTLTVCSLMSHTKTVYAFELCGL